MLDFDLAELYNVETRALKQAVRRNMERFPDDFMFELTPDEFNNLRSQFVISSWGGTRYMPFAFTEQGVAMLASVLQSKKAIETNIAIIRVFVALRRYALTYDELAAKLAEHDRGLNRATFKHPVHNGRGSVLPRLHPVVGLRFAQTKRLQDDRVGNQCRLMIQRLSFECKG